MRYKKGTYTTVPNREVLRGLDPHAQIIFVWLCSYADEEGVCFPSLTKLARDCGTTRRTIIRKLTILEERGLIERTRRKKRSGVENDSNEYQIMVLEPSDTESLSSDRKSLGGDTESLRGGDTESLELKPIIQTKTNKKSEIKFTPKDLELVTLFTGLIESNNPGWQMRGSPEKWAEDINKLHRIDKRTYEQIEFMVRWTQQDPFWSQNILSASKLREKFNDLIPRVRGQTLKIQAQKPKTAVIQ